MLLGVMCNSSPHHASVDPSEAVVRRTNTQTKQTSLSPEVKKSLQKSEALLPRLYRLPKIHKANAPLRLIVSAIGSLTCGLTQYLAGRLTPFIGGTDSYVQDSRHFIEKISSITLGPQDILVTFDMVSLIHDGASMRDDGVYTGTVSG